ncbi:double zinc ribbon domain-containing protein [Halorussus aquaticus]|uniref:Zinc ribbon domain-containing protein n=1 Tax=Halorussus aquaticus TaxID=2953748 RepID=A0ABD5Q1M0_9EURY|nr:zinc ribbon domain-containing protein [Halorussus aquaticus]
MSKITFRADEELVERIEARDASKSEIMREALREYLDASDDANRARRSPTADADRVRDVRRATTSEGGHGERRSADRIDDVLAQRVDELVAERLAAWEASERERDRGERARDVNVNVTLDTDAARTDASADRHANASDELSDGRPPERAADADGREPSDETENACGQCGESLSDDHVYCPNCGEKAARRVFCECGDEVRSDWGFCPSCGRRTPAADVLDRS